MSTLNKLIKAALDTAHIEEPWLFHSDLRDKLEEKLIAATNYFVPEKLSLSANNIDFDSILLRLVQELQIDPVWSDLVTSGTGMTILRNLASGIYLTLTANERALQEAFPGSAYSSNSIMMAARMLGVNPTRRTPAKVHVDLVKLDDNTPLTIPKFSSFSINKVLFFNREQIVFDQSTVNVSVVLYQGHILELTATSEGVESERIEIGTESGLISQEDVYVYVDGVEWRKSLVGPYTFGRTEKAVYVSTLPNSNVEILFGDNRYGAVPPVNSYIKIVWAETEGEIQNSNQSGLAVTYVNSPSGVNITGYTTSAIYGGSEAASPEFYRLQAPHIRASGRIYGERRSDYKSIAMEYPGVVDALFRGEAELNPNKRASWMNVVGATVLTKSGLPMGPQEWLDFEAYMNDRDTYKVKFLKLDPQPVDIQITAKVYCKPSANLAVLKSKLEADTRERFKPQRGTLGYSIFKSDISDVLDGKDDYADLVEYSTDITPQTDTILSAYNQFIRVTYINYQLYYTTRSGYTGRVEPWEN